MKSYKKRTLYILDRNVVDIIKKANKGKEIADQKKKTKLEFLRKIDRVDSLISPALSMIEGQKGRQENFHEKIDVLQKETLEVGKFFTRAKTDASVMASMANEFADAFSNPAEEDWNTVEAFLLDACPLIANKPGEKKRERIESEIFALADHNKITRSHLAVVLCLACLYGSEPARLTIKPHAIKEQSHNVMNDIHVLPRINLMRASMKAAGINDIEIEYVTCDDGLEKILSSVDVILSALNGSNDGIHQIIRYQKKLFPSLSKIEYFRLMNSINKKNNDGASQ